jgi:hypothetical protein
MNKDLFSKISKSVKNIIMYNIQAKYNYVNSLSIYNRMNLCNDNSSEFLLFDHIIRIIHENCEKKYNDMIIYLVVLFLYYALILQEQTDDYLYIEDLKYIKKEFFDDAYSLFFEIATGDKEYSSKIRRLFFKFDELQ